MGQFLIIKSTGGNDLFALTLWDSAQAAAKRLWPSSSETSVKMKDIFAGYFTRLNNTGSGIVQDKTTSSWLLSIGTWFHNSGINSGAEKELFSLLLANEDPKKICEGLDGFFNLLFYDGRTEKLYIITDIIGSCFCFIRRMKECILISNSSQLLAHTYPCRIDLEACQEFIHTGIIYGDKSLFSEVRRISPASILVIGQNNAERNYHYWKISNISSVYLKGDKAVLEFGQCLKEIAKLINSALPNSVCDLTAGMDSRVLMSGFLSNNQKLNTVVVGTPGSLDVIISKELAKLSSLNHMHIEPKLQYSYDLLKSLIPITDGEYNLIEYASIYYVHKALSEIFSAGLNGSFGEVARGYWWELLFPHIGKNSKLNSMLLSRKRFAVGDYIDFWGVEKIALEERLASEIDNVTGPLANRPNTFQMDSCYLYMRMRCWQGRIASSTNRIWPCFSPMMMRPMLELLLTIEPKLRMNDQLYKKYLKKFNPMWGEHRTNQGVPAGPMTPFNAFKFWPVPFKLSKKVIRKALGVLGINENTAIKVNQNKIIREQLQKDSNFLNSFAIENMVLANYTDKKVLKRFMDKSFTPDFRYDVCWQRIISLESTLKHEITT